MSDKVNKAIAGLNAAFGKGFITAGSLEPDAAVPVVSTGSYTLDDALGVGGLPRGRIVEIFGPNGAGKTTLALQAVAAGQAQGLECAFIDMEHALDVKYAQALGVDFSKLVFTQPSCGEEALEAAIALANAGCGVVVIDSVASCIPKKMLEGDVGDERPASLARLMSQNLQKIAMAANTGNCLILFLNQIRYKVGIVYGNPETTMGGESLKYYASIRIDVRPKSKVTTGKESEKEVVGNDVTAKVIKNKLAPPYREANFKIIFGHGVDKSSEILELAESKGIVKRNGAWYYYGDLKIGQGAENALAYLRDNADVREKIVQEIFG